MDLSKSQLTDLQIAIQEHDDDMARLDRNRATPQLLEQITMNEQLEAHAERLSYVIQLATGMSEGARLDLKQLLIQFAEEIKRQAIEP